MKIHGGEEFFTKDALRSNRESNDSIGIRLKNAVHPGKKFLITIFSAIVYCKSRPLKIAKLRKSHETAKDGFRPSKSEFKTQNKNKKDKMSR